MDPWQHIEAIRPGRPQVYIQNTGLRPRPVAFPYCKFHIVKHYKKCSISPAVPTFVDHQNTEPGINDFKEKLQFVRK